MTIDLRLHTNARLVLIGNSTAESYSISSPACFTDRHLQDNSLPFGKLRPRTRVPIVAIAVQGALAIVIAVAGAYEQILSYVVSIDSLFFGVTAACLFGLREKAARTNETVKGTSDALRVNSAVIVLRPLLDRFLDSRDDIEAFRPAFGTVVAPRLKWGRIERLCELLREKYETSVVPGHFFETPEHFRIGIGCETEMLAEGLQRLGAAMDEMATICTHPTF